MLATLLLAALVAIASAQSPDFNVAQGKYVSASRVAADNYPDGDGLKLTDGSYQFSWGDMVGWEGSEPIVLTVDLGDVHDYVSYVALKVSLFIFIWTWTDSLNPLIYLTDDRLYTLAIGLQQLSSTHAAAWPLLMAGSLLMSLPIVVLFFFAQKTFIAGVLPYKASSLEYPWKRVFEINYDLELTL